MILLLVFCVLGVQIGITTLTVLAATQPTSEAVLIYNATQAALAQAAMWQAITGIIATFGTVLTAYIAFRMRQLEHNTNSKMDELVKTTLALGKEQGKSTAEAVAKTEAIEVAAAS